MRGLRYRTSSGELAFRADAVRSSNPRDGKVSQKKRRSFRAKVGNRYDRKYVVSHGTARYIIYHADRWRGKLEKKLRALLEKGISRHRGPRRTVFSSRSIQFPARTGVAFGLINTCRRCKQVFDPYICQERSGEWCGHGARNLLFQESIEDEASICFFSRKPSPSSSSSLPRRNSESVRKFLARAIVLTVFEWAA